MPRDQDLKYILRVQDAQLRELRKNVTALNKELSASGPAAARSGKQTQTAYAGAGRAAGISMKQVVKGAAAVGIAYQGWTTGIQIMKQSVEAADNLNDQLRSVKQVVGDVVGSDVEGWAKGLADNFGLAADQGLQYVRQMATVFKVVGLNDDQTAKYSERLVELASDMALFNRVPIADTMSALSRGISGQLRGLKQYGIVIDAATIKQEAMRETGKRTAEELTRGDLVVARYNLILRDASVQSGTFAERTDDLSQRSQVLHARLRNIEAGIGEMLIPKLEQAAGAAIDLSKALEKVGKVPGSKGFFDKLFTVGLPTALEQGPKAFQKMVKDWQLILQGKGFQKVPTSGGDNPLDAIVQNLSRTITDVQNAFTGAADHIEKVLRTRLGAAFDDVRKKAEQAFDDQTDALLTNFDRTTDRLLQKVTAVVRVGKEQFRIGEGQKTPAERELDALDKLDARRGIQQGLSDARKNLGQALLLGDPEQIQQAQRQVRDAEEAQRRFRLQARAETERKLADKALSAQQQAFRDQRDTLRKHLAERRQIERDSLDKELQAEADGLAKGKVTAENAQKEILATLAKYGVAYAGVGKALGGKFLDGFSKGLTGDKGVLLITPDVTLRSDDKGQITLHMKKGKGAARGGMSGSLGPAGPSDTIPAWLTPGEMILTGRDQQRLARMLGTGAVGGALLSQIRMGFADGGVADGALFQRLLRELTKMLAGDASSRAKALADPKLLKGGLSASERKALLPIHLQAELRKAGGAGLDLNQKRALLGELAQREAHPVRSGLLRMGPRGISAGKPHAIGGVSDMNFGGGMTWNITESRSARETAREVRKELIRLSKRNAKRLRGRNAGSIVGLR